MGRRARIPTKKAIEAQETMKLMSTKQKQSEIQGNQEVVGIQIGVSQTLKEFGEEMTRAEVEHGAVIRGTPRREDLHPQPEDVKNNALKSDETVQKSLTVNGQETVTSPKSILKEWNEAIHMSNSSGRKSWADEVEKEDEMPQKPSMWENFDITKTSNARFKLEFVTPITQGEAQVC